MIKKAERIKDVKKIQSEILTLKKTLFNLRFQKSNAQLEKTHEIKLTRRKIASLKTFLKLKTMEDRNA